MTASTWLKGPGVGDGLGGGGLGGSLFVLCISGHLPGYLNLNLNLSQRLKSDIFVSRDHSGSHLLKKRSAKQ